MRREEEPWSERLTRIRRLAEVREEGPGFRLGISHGAAAMVPLAVLLGVIHAYAIGDDPGLAMTLLGGTAGCLVMLWALTHDRERRRELLRVMAGLLVLLTALAAIVLLANRLSAVGAVMSPYSRCEECVGNGRSANPRAGI